MSGKFLVQLLDDGARSDYFSDGNRMDPDRGLSRACCEGGRNPAKPLSQTGAILSVAQHLQQPVGQRQQQEQREQRTVERVHEGRFILNGGGRFDLL